MKYFILISLFCCSHILYANNEILINFDDAFFQDLDNKTRWELYFNVPDYTFTFLKNENAFQGKLDININIYSSDILVENKNWALNHKIDDLNDTNKIYLFGLIKFFLNPGQYKVKIKVIDRNDISRVLEKEMNLIVPNLNIKNISIGGILMESISFNTDTSKVIYDETFLKFNSYIFPNPSLVYYGNYFNLKGYIEIYNAYKYAQSGILVYYNLYDATYRLMRSKEIKIEAVDDFLIETFNLECDSIHTGVYYFEVKTKFPLDNIKDSAAISKRIYVVNSDLPPLTRRYYTENELFQKSIFATITPSELETELSIAKIVGEVEDINQIDLLTNEDAKRRYLFKFWMNRDTDTTTSINESYVELKKSFRYSNHFFSVGFNNDGWNTPRGKVTLRYGLPTERKQHDIEYGNRGYEEWFYANVQGGTYFYFVDISNVGKYILVHSTARNEPYNPNWYKDYVPNTFDRRNQMELEGETNMPRLR